jgi:transposase InsO family protein
MSRAGNLYDNAHIESVVKTLKHEEVCLKGYRTWAELSAVLPTYLDTVFNGARLHSALGCLPPVAYEQQHHLTRTASVNSPTSCYPVDGGTPHICAVFNRH